MGRWRDIFKGVLTAYTVKSAANMIIDAINRVIDALNSIRIDIPSWVPVLAVKHGVLTYQNTEA